jgi:hypothetical protein
MSTEHTPGIWETTIHQGHEAVALVGPIRQIIADCGLQDEAEANARLIAAAPDLLAKLERLTQVAGQLNAKYHAGFKDLNREWSDLFQSENAARGAIEKATAKGGGAC